MADQQESLNDQMISRRQKADEMREAGIDPFGHRYDRTHTAEQLHELYDDVSTEELEAGHHEVKIA